MRNYLFRYGKAKYISNKRTILRFAERQAIEAEKKAQQQEQGLLHDQAGIALTVSNHESIVKQQKIINVYMIVYVIMHGVRDRIVSCKCYMIVWSSCVVCRHYNL
jgi:hypothetical protein